MAERALGHVTALWRYPVKSMAGEPLDRVEVSWHGLVGDRRWAFVRGDVPRSGFPWLTIRERPEMARYEPFFADPGWPDKSRTIVRTPGGEELEVADPALAAELREGTHAIKQDRGVFDAFPLSVITTQSIAAAGELVGTALDPKRFRPNILVEASDDEAFQEDTWVGMTLRIGGLRMRVDKRDERCVIVNLDLTRIERTPNVLGALGRVRGGRIGVYGSTVEPGRVTVGDRVSIEN